MGEEIKGGLVFEEALDLLKQGRRVARAGWNGKGLSVSAQFPDVASKMTRTYLVMHPSPVDAVPWLPSMTDVFASDWYEVELSSNQ